MGRAAWVDLCRARPWLAGPFIGDFGACSDEVKYFSLRAFLDEVKPPSIRGVGFFYLVLVSDENRYVERWSEMKRSEKVESGEG